MPIYEYKCLECGYKFEIHRSIKEADLETKCPSCGENNVQRIFSLFMMNSPSGACTSNGST